MRRLHTLSKREVGRIFDQNVLVGQTMTKKSIQK